MLSRHIQAERAKVFGRANKQIENKRSLEYQCNKMRDQIILDNPSPYRYNGD